MSLKTWKVVLIAWLCVSMGAGPVLGAVAAVEVAAVAAACPGAAVGCPGAVVHLAADLR